MQLGVKKDTLWIFWVAWISWLRSGLSLKTKKLNFQQFWLILGGVANISVQISFKKLIFRKFLSWNRFRRSLISTCPHTIQLPGTSKLEILLNWERAVFMVANYIFIKKEILSPLSCLWVDPQYCSRWHDKIWAVPSFLGALYHDCVAWYKRITYSKLYWDPTCCKFQKETFRCKYVFNIRSRISFKGTFLKF